MQPTELRVTNEGTVLEILWDDGARQSLSAAWLRTQSRGAPDVRARADGRSVEAEPDISMTGIDPVGRYAINIKFSDGYDRGIYPWSMLRDLNTQEETRGTQNG